MYHVMLHGYHFIVHTTCTTHNITMHSHMHIHVHTHTHTIACSVSRPFLLGAEEDAARVSYHCCCCCTSARACSYDGEQQIEYHTIEVHISSVAMLPLLSASSILPPLSTHPPNRPQQPRRHRGRARSLRRSGKRQSSLFRGFSRSVRPGEAWQQTRWSSCSTRTSTPCNPSC